MIENEAEFAPRPSSILREGNRVNPAGHGLLSLFKKTTQRKIKLAICVCVYSEPKHMLKSTIKGIQESYKHFYQKAGIMSHEIILVVIFDGIEKVNNSKEQTDNMISYFNEFDLKNGFRHKPYGKTVEEYFKEFADSLENYDDVSIFTEKELEELRGKLF
jgi:chitin synthase